MNEILEILECITLNRIREHIQALEGVRHPVTAPEALEDAANYIFDSLQSSGCEMSVHRFHEDQIEYRNIIGTLKGSNSPEKRIIVLAHFDTVSNSPGANDNASGVAAILEIARVLKGHKFDKNIQFIGVNLEEQKNDGVSNTPITRGSRALAEHARKSNWEIEGVIDLEEIAYAGEDITQSAPTGIPIEIPETGNFIGIFGNENSKDLVEGFKFAVDQYHLPLPCVTLVVPGNGEILPDTRRSDNAPFWDNGYCAIMVMDTTNFRTPYYHQSSDTLDTLNLEFATEVCRATAGMAMDMAGCRNI